VRWQPAAVGGLVLGLVVMDGVQRALCTWLTYAKY
jgi:hypothetical protein